jgi:hypothetical protein
MTSRITVIEYDNGCQKITFDNLEEVIEFFEKSLGSHLTTTFCGIEKFNGCIFLEFVNGQILDTIIVGLKEEEVKQFAERLSLEQD